MSERGDDDLMLDPARIAAVATAWHDKFETAVRKDLRRAVQSRENSSRVSEVESLKKRRHEPRHRVMDGRTRKHKEPA